MDEESVGPYDSEPLPEIRAAADRNKGDTVAAAHARWREAVEGIPMGAYDRRIVDWAEQAMDQGTLWVFAGLLDRARSAGRPGGDQG
jgi:hypothetical protein